MSRKHYRAMVSSDWNECLAPCGPFDYIAFLYPELEKELADIFKQYTGNVLPLSRAMEKIAGLIPEPVTPDRMDDYLRRRFATYTGVPELMEWCRANDILFMINTTGAVGYFQRIFANRMLPPVPFLSAHPGLRFAARGSDPENVIALHEVGDKGPNTRRVAASMNIPASRIILMGDSGGDGPHFAWGQSAGAFLIGSMAKPSLKRYCRENHVPVDLFFGISYDEGRAKNLKDEMAADFRDLIPVIAQVAATAKP